MPSPLSTTPQNQPNLGPNAPKTGSEATAAEANLPAKVVSADSREEKESELEFIQVVDRTFYAVVRFVQAFLWTICALLFQPSSVGKRLHQTATGTDIPRPVVFLMLLAAAFNQYYHSPIEDGTSWTDYVDLLIGSYSSPSLIDLVLATIPTVGVTYLLSTGLARMIAPNAVEERNVVRSAAFYSIGCQVVLMLACTLLWTCVLVYFPGGTDSDLEVMAHIVMALFWLLVVIWPAIVLVRLIQAASSFVFANHGVWQRIAIGVSCVSFCIAVLILNLVFVHILAKNRLSVTGSLTSMGWVNKSEKHELLAEFLFTNQGSEACFLKPLDSRGKSELVIIKSRTTHGLEEAVIRSLEWQDAQESVLMIEPGKTRWLKVRFPEKKFKDNQGILPTSDLIVFITLPFYSVSHQQPAFKRFGPFRLDRVWVEQ